MAGPSEAGDGSAGGSGGEGEGGWEGQMGTPLAHWGALGCGAVRLIP